MGRVASLLVCAALLALLGLRAFEKGAFGQITDFDELWHLASGRVIVETASVPEKDPFTFTAGEARWVNTNWLAQLVLWTVYRRGGFALVWLLAIALFAGTIALAHLAARARSPSGLGALYPAFAVLSGLAVVSHVRPQGWTFLLLALAML